MKLAAVFGLCCIFAVSGCDKVRELADPKARLIADARAAVRQGLDDPQASIETDQRMADGKTVCGVVRASRRAPLGHMPYVYSADIGALILDRAPTREDLRTLWRTGSRELDTWQTQWDAVQSRCQIVDAIRRSCPMAVSAHIAVDSVCEVWSRNHWSIPNTLAALGEDPRGR